MLLIGERWKGTGDNTPDKFFVTLGTGVGGGIIIKVNYFMVSMEVLVRLVIWLLMKMDFHVLVEILGVWRPLLALTGIVNIAKTLLVNLMKQVN